MSDEETGWWAEWDEDHREWHPTVQLPGSMMASFESWGFPTKADCLAFIRDHLPSLGRMHPTAEDGPT